MDQEEEKPNSEDTSLIEVQLARKSSCNGEGNLTSAKNGSDDEKCSGKETPDLSNGKVNDGDISKEIADQHVSRCSESDTEFDDTSTIGNESTNENAESVNILINDDKQKDIDENLKLPDIEDLGNIEQNDTSSTHNSKEYDDLPKLTSEICEDTLSENGHQEHKNSSEIEEEVTPVASVISNDSKDNEMVKPNTDDDDEDKMQTKKEIGINWSEGIQEELVCELIQDEKGAEIERLESSLKAEKEMFAKVTCDPHECGDNLIANKAEEGCTIQTPGVEVIGPKTNDEMKNNLSEREKSEDIKDSQRPRSRSYPYKVLASGLPLGARRDDVMYYFSQFGEVLKLWDEGRHRANVLFADEESFKKAVFAPDPYFDDHKLLIRSLNETITIISGIPRSTPAKDAETALKSVLEEAGVAPCRITIPLSDPSETTGGNLIQGHALVAFCDPQTLQKAEEIERNGPFMMGDCPLKLYSSCNEFYEKFCIRVFPLPADWQRSVLCRNLYAAFESFGNIVAIVCQYGANSTSYTGYVLFESEDSVQKAKEKDEVKICEEFVQIQDFHPFDQGQGFRHLWLKVLNLPSRATITEIKHHFGHDKGILNIELDLDFGSCYIHVNSEATIQRCLQMHQTYLRGKCLAVLIAEDHPDRAYYREISRRGRRPNYRNSTSRKKTGTNNSATGFNGKTFTSATQPQGNQDRRGFERGDRKFSKSRSNASHSKESPKPVKEDGDGVKIADSPAV